MGFTLICALFSVAFTFSIEKITWIWDGKKPIAAVLIVLAIVFGALWFQAQRRLSAKS